MSGYIKADFMRVLRSVKVWVAFLGWGALLCFMCSVVGSGAGEGRVISAFRVMFWFLPLVTGTSVYLAIVNDDLSAGVMVHAVGSGVARWKVIVAKLIQGIIWTCIVGVIECIFIYVAPLLTDAGMTQSISNYGMSSLIVACLAMVGYFAMALPFAYGMRGNVGGIVVYVALSTTIVGNIVESLLSTGVVKQIFGNIANLVLERGLENAQTSWLAQSTLAIPGDVWSALALTVAYVVVAVAIVAVVVIAGAVFFRGYYSEHYVTTKYAYTQVPKDISTVTSPEKNSDGNVEEGFIQWEITAYTEDGSKADVSFTEQVDNGSSKYKPGSYIKFGLSSSGAVQNQTVIKKADIPSAALSAIETGQK